MLLNIETFIILKPNGLSKIHLSRIFITLSVIFSLKTYQFQLDHFFVNGLQIPVADGLVFSARNEIPIFFVSERSDGKHGVAVAYADSERIRLQVVNLK